MTAALTGLATTTLATACPCLKVAPPESSKPDGDGQPRDDGDPLEEASPQEGGAPPEERGADEAAAIEDQEAARAKADDAS